MSEECVQLITYIRRNPKLTLEQFYEYWEKVHGPKVIPVLEKYDVLEYSQVNYKSPVAVTVLIIIKVHNSGKAYFGTTSFWPGENKSAPPTELRDYDGIALFTVKSVERFMEAFKDPYFVDVVLPDEYILIDKEGPGAGIVASLQGRLVRMFKDGKNARGEEGEEYADVFKESEEKARGEGSTAP